jgi:hypothetical protein
MVRNVYGGVIKKKIRHCFFKAGESKMVNCVSASAAPQHNDENKLKLPTEQNKVLLGAR